MYEVNYNNKRECAWCNECNIVQESYSKGREDAINECKALFRKYILTKEIEGLDELFEQLKEQK